MSPVYKELLLKLVMSMSRDELFIRSKNIMDQEKMKSGGLKSNSNLDALALLQQTAPAATATAPPTVTKSSGFGSLLGFRKPFLGRKTTKPEAETKSSKNKKSSLGLSVGSKANFTSSGSIASRRKNSSKRRRGGKTAANVETVKNLVAAANNNNNNESNAKSSNTAVIAKSAKKKFSKSDISQPIPVIKTSKPFLNGCFFSV